MVDILEQYLDSNENISDNFSDEEIFIALARVYR